MLLDAKPDGTFGYFGEACYLIEGNLTVRVRRAGRDVFQWKKKELAVTPEILSELMGFRRDLEKALSLNN